MVLRLLTMVQSSIIISCAVKKKFPASLPFISGDVHLGIVAMKLLQCKFPDRKLQFSQRLKYL